MVTNRRKIIVYDVQLENWVKWDKKLTRSNVLLEGMPYSGTDVLIIEWMVLIVGAIYR